ncbi:uncharacterized protein LOC122245565 [Penaeus japonicus]|uniref:uncharacterized protein LOC122245565 n=1 Tax=Penaeus japonicus TaxID=27405 RepID=UPI001C713817|nr:uncharacterized protein LOC122245565 [Penaeus japonicus]
MASLMNDLLRDFDYDSVFRRHLSADDIYGVMMVVLLFLVVCDIASLLTIVADSGDGVRWGAAIGRAFGSFEHHVEENGTARSLETLRPVLTAIGNGIRNYQHMGTGRRLPE